MKKLTAVICFISLFSLGGVFWLTGCENEDAKATPCVDDGDCTSTQACFDNFCASCKCKELGGTCTLIDDDCAAGTFDWSGLECPGGREEKCCLPDSSCSAIGGTCIDWESTCPDGTGAYGSMDCPNDRYDQCCVPVR